MRTTLRDSGGFGEREGDGLGVTVNIRQWAVPETFFDGHWWAGQERSSTT